MVVLDRGEVFSHQAELSKLMQEAWQRYRHADPAEREAAQEEYAKAIQAFQESLDS